MDMNESVFECVGKSGGILYSNASGYLYRVKEKRSDSRWRLMCVNAKCKGRAVLHNPNSENRHISETVSHTCSPDFTKQYDAVVKKYMKDFLKETTNREEQECEPYIKEECPEINEEENPEDITDTSISEEEHLLDIKMETEENEPVSELLPGPKGQPMYYDGCGYYYNQISENQKNRSLQCSHKGCSVLAEMESRDGAPIRLVNSSYVHNHGPNTERRERIMFVHAIKTRHANENTPFTVIFQEEADKNPVGASFFSVEKIEKHLKKKLDQSSSESQPSSSVVTPKTTMKTRGRPSPIKEPLTKRRKTDHSPVTGVLSKKLELLKTLKSVSSPQLNKTGEAVKSSERLPGPHPHSFIYHDGNGHYYKPLSISGDTRRLKCKTPGCPAQAVMSLEENAPIRLEVSSSPHNHPPELLQEHKPVSPPQKKSVKPSQHTPKIKLTTPKTAEAQEPIPAISSDQIPTVALTKVKTPTRSVTPRARAYGKKSKDKLKQDFDELEAEMENICGPPEVPKRSERIQGPEFFYDFRGHYYFSTCVEKNKRYLRCLAPTCCAEATMSLEDNAEICPVAGSRPHNHLPDLTTDYHKKIKQWDDQWAACLPSERLPSLSVQYCCYHDGRGYYYHQTSQADNIRYLACTEPECPVRAHMCTQKNAPITLSALRPGHNHDPDHTLRDALLFIDAVRVRCRSDTPPATAIHQETLRNSVGATRVDQAALQLCLEKAVKLSKNKCDEEIAEDEVDFASCLKLPTKNTLKPSTESQIPVYNHFSSAQSNITNVPDGDTDKCLSDRKDQVKSEMVPAPLLDSWMFHDGCGYYYTVKNTTNTRRYLQCVVPKCGVQASTDLLLGSPVKAQKPHNHGPEPPHYRNELWFFYQIREKAIARPDKEISKIYHEVAQKDPEGAALISEEETVNLMKKYISTVIFSLGKTDVRIPEKSVAEKVPDIVFGQHQYHDGQGHYYVVENYSSQKKYLKCSAPSCPARATLIDEPGAEVIPEIPHNHEPDPIHRDLCLFTSEVKRRARDEDTPITTIYKEEAQKYPNAASVLKEDKVIEKLLNIRKHIKYEMDITYEYDSSEERKISVKKAQPKQVPSQMLPGRYKPIYFDGKGYYYLETFTVNTSRYLMCVEPHCLAQAQMVLQSRAPIFPLAGGPHHCHPPDPLRRDCYIFMDSVRKRLREYNRTFYGDTFYKLEYAKNPIICGQIPKESLMKIMIDIKYAENRNMDTTKPKHENENPVEEEELWEAKLPAERLPIDQGWIYHDGRGYFFFCHHTDQANKRKFLKCWEDNCDATAWLDSGKEAPIVRAVGSVLHNHGAELQRRSMLLLLHRVATRARLENKTIPNIFELEARNYAGGASLIPKNQLGEILHNMTIRKYFKDLDEEEFGAEKENFSDDFYDETEFSEVLCEMLQSINSNKPVYHDGRGFYFTDLRKTYNKQYLKCLVPLCKARAFISLSEPWNLHTPISLDQHNHKPDTLYRNKLLFINNIRQRVLEEDTPIPLIYSDEVMREIVGADLISEVAVKNFMYNLRKSQGTKEVKYITAEEYIDESVDEGTVESFDGVNHLESAQSSSKKEISKSSQPVKPQATANYRAMKSPMQKDLPSSKTGKNIGNEEYTEEEYLEEERLEDEFNNETVEEDYSSNYYKRKEVKLPLYGNDVYKPTEKLPCRNNKTIYHNGQGYYFHFTAIKDKVMYLQCAEPRCKVRALKSTEREDAPIIPTKDCMVHSHKPDPIRKIQLLFLHRCKQRAATETNLSINEIWESESSRDPVTASKMSAQNVKAQMREYRLSQTVYANKQTAFSAKSSGENTEGSKTSHDASTTDFLLESDRNTSTLDLDDDIHQGAVPEKVPSLANDVLWHAAGYFYSTYDTTPKVEKLKCVDNGCNARATLTKATGGAPASIRLNKNTFHIHEPDYQKKNQLVFIDRCKKMAAITLRSVDDVYHEEAAKMPEVAAQLSAVRVKKAMSVAKKKHQKQKASADKKKDDHDHGMTELSEMSNMTWGSRTVTYKEEEPAVPSECLLHSGDGGLVYHDGRGFYYNELSLQGADRLLKCRDCNVRAVMALAPANAPIVLCNPGASHTHPPYSEKVSQVESKPSTKPQTTPKTTPRPKPMPTPKPKLLGPKSFKERARVSESEEPKLLGPKSFKERSSLSENEEPKLLGPKSFKERLKASESEEPKLLGPKSFKERARVSESEEIKREPGEQVDEKYTDYVTLEDDDSFDVQGLDTEDDPNDPDFVPSSSTIKIEDAEIYDANGYCYVALREGSKRYLQCKTKCGVVVNLGPKQKPLAKLIIVSPKHNHPPEASKQKSRNLTELPSVELSNQSQDMSEDEYEELEYLEEEYLDSGGQDDDTIEEIAQENIKQSESTQEEKYPDVDGYYYSVQKITDDGMRFMKCVENNCRARGYIPPKFEEEVVTDCGPPHNHPTDPSYNTITDFLKKSNAQAAEENNTDISETYDEESVLDHVSASAPKETAIQKSHKVKSKRSKTKENFKYDSDRSEVLPGVRPNSVIYHDCKGYYFIFNALKENKRYLRCIDPRCKVRGSMFLYDGAPIKTNPNIVHNHRPDFQRKKFVLFLQRCKKRAMTERTPISQIYKEESQKDPLSSSKISSHNLLQRMQRARKLATRYYPTDEDQTEFADACNSTTSITEVPPHELVEENDSHSQDENAASEAPSDTDDNGEEDPESEAIEKAISQVVNDGSTPTISKDQVPEGAPVPEDQLQPSEVLPGIRPNSVMYYDGRGYYYIFNTQRENVWYLRCLESQCRVRAHMEPGEGNHIIQSPNTLHNHRPDFKRKQFVLWMERAKNRAVTEDLPIPTIYAQEAAKDPESASFISEENMRTRLYRARKAMNKQDSEVVSVVEDESKVSEDKETLELMVTDSESNQMEDGEAVYAIQTEDSEDGNTVYVYQSTDEPSSQRPTFVDNKGYCYQQTTIRNNCRYLKCVEEGCKARANMGLEDNATISLNKAFSHHNHPPEHSELTMLLDPSQLGESADMPVQVIYTDNNEEDHVAVCHITEDVLSTPKRHYKQRQKPEITIDTEVDTSVDVAAGDYYHNEDQQKYPLKPSEVIPGLRPDANNYHDGNGFYYELNRQSQNIRYLKCLIKDCKARAYMEVGKENAPIIQTNFAKHNHGPDLTRKQFTVFLHRVTRRAAEEDTPINVIYQQEAERDPQSARQIRAENVKQRMMRYRKKHRNSKSSQDAPTEMNLDNSVYQWLEGEEKDITDSDEYYAKEQESKVEVKSEENEENLRNKEDESMYTGYVSEIEVESQQQ